MTVYRVVVKQESNTAVLEHSLLKKLGLILRVNHVFDLL
jgi:hypothetical protein